MRNPYDPTTQPKLHEGAEIVLRAIAEDSSITVGDVAQQMGLSMRSADAAILIVCTVIHGLIKNDALEPAA